MFYVAVDELLKKVGGIYKLTVLASKRAAELSAGSPPLIDDAEIKDPIGVALEEIRQGKIGCK